MTEIKNIQCVSCGEFIPVDAAICQFCGEKTVKESDNSNDDATNEFLEDEVQEISKKDGNKLFIMISSLTVVFVLGLLFTFSILKHFSPEISLPKLSKNQKNTHKPKVNVLGSRKSSSDLKKAIELFKVEKYDLSAELLQKEIDLYDNAEAYYYMAQIYSERGFTNLALKTYKQADLKRKNYAEPKIKLAQMYLNKYDYETAEKYAQDALNINPKDIKTLEILVRVYSLLGKTDKVIETHKKIVAVEPKNYDSNYELANYYYGRDEYKAAIPYINTILDIEFNSNIAYSLASCYVKIEYYTKAMEVLDRIMVNDRDEASYARYLKANISLLREDYRLNNKPAKTAPTPPAKSKKSDNNYYDYNLEDSATNELF